MNLFLRWWKFNLVGAMGMAAQLALLAFFHRLTGRHYLFATAAAVELTLLHNFFWHRNSTWRDRLDDRPLVQLLRFHLSNGTVSITGNLALMPLLYRAAHVPLLLANLAAILCCSIVNFFLGHCWAFAVKA